ncbi:tetratricopeptide repeat protein, partial [bacterium]|nr:tetratricopeptide repeat protein [bacterium]
ALWVIVALLAVGAVMLALYVSRVRVGLGHMSQLEPIDSLAVLPLKNLSGDQNQEYFVDGMTEELISKLAHIESLRVISRTSVMEYKKKQKPITQIAKELNVDVIVEGSVMQAGNRVRITAQLIHAPTDRHLWAESYEREMRDILSLQNEVASAIAREIKVKLTPETKTYLADAPQIHPGAYQAYLRGLDLWTNVSVMGEQGQQLRLATKMFERAVELDPSFALAHSYLSQAHSYMYFTGVDRSQERLVMAKEAVDRAFALSPGLAKAHEALGRYYYWGFRDYNRALQELAIARKELHSDPWLVGIIAAIQRRQGQWEESLKNWQIAFELDPRKSEMPFQICNIYLKLRRYSEADRYCNLSIALSPDQINSYIMKVLISLNQDGETHGAKNSLDKIPNQVDPEVIYWSIWVNVFERNYDTALERLPAAMSESLSEQAIFMPWVELQGLVHHLQGNSDLARSSFESAREILEKEVKLRPDDPRVHSSLGIAYAGLNRKKDAIREGKLSVELLPISKDAIVGPYFVAYLAEIYVMVGEYDAAVDQLEYVLSIPSNWSTRFLQIDPRWDPLRNHPRFQKLIQKYS